jgi:hypothetical protein
MENFFAFLLDFYLYFPDIPRIPHNQWQITGNNNSVTNEIQKHFLLRCNILFLDAVLSTLFQIMKQNTAEMQCVHDWLNLAVFSVKAL